MNPNPSFLPGHRVSLPARFIAIKPNFTLKINITAISSVSHWWLKTPDTKWLFQDSNQL